MERGLVTVLLAVLLAAPLVGVAPAAHADRVEVPDGTGDAWVFGPGGLSPAGPVRTSTWSRRPSTTAPGRCG